jgi:hypothetical protein
MGIEPYRRRGAPVRAEHRRACRWHQQLVAAPDKEHQFATRVAKQHGSVRNH